MKEQLITHSQKTRVKGKTKDYQLGKAVVKDSEMTESVKKSEWKGKVKERQTDITENRKGKKEKKNENKSENKFDGAHCNHSLSQP